jgi:dTDP-4-amino-4,6-dideoxygalactose transaminase
MLRVPYVSLPLRVRRVKREIMEAVERVVDSGVYVLGPEVARFEEAIANYCGVKYAIGVSDGTMALILTLRALGVGPGDEVLTAPNSFVASASCAALVGATPTFVDVRRGDMNLDPDKLDKAITPRTKAIIAVHLAGHAADIDAIVRVASARGVPVIEDAAQAIGSRYKGRRVGGLARAACFSLHPLKNLHGIGDGGLITTDDPALYAWLLKARNHGLKTRDEAEFWSTNSRLDPLQAAILGVMLAHLDTWIEERRAIAHEFCDALRDVVGVPTEAEGYFHTYQTFVIHAERRAALLKHLEAHGVDAKVHYPRPIPLQEAARALEYVPDDFPLTHWLSEHIVSLPLYAEMTREQRDAVIHGVRSFYRP